MGLNYAPSSTYRLQLNKDFPLRDALSITSYLEKLGIGACYLSPVTMARPGSPHGYDVVDHGRLNPELGTEDDFGNLAEDLKRRQMGVILDIVANHMCITHQANGWWWDVLENGPSSPYGRFFDIDWEPPKLELLNRVLLPWLGDQFGVVLESGQIRVRQSRGSFLLDCYETSLPLEPKSWPVILQPAMEAIAERRGQDDGVVAELESIMAGLANLPDRTDTDSDRMRERYREKEILKRRLDASIERNSDVRSAIARSVDELNGTPGDPASFDRLEELLSRQVYRLAYWRVAADEINYRRFFDINELAAIRVEDPEVFQAVHAKIFDFIRRDWVHGLRVDHPDGLYEPQKYFENLREGCLAAWRDGSNDNPDADNFFVVAEKILIGNEELRPGWRIEGTTGYGFLNLLNGLYVQPSSRRNLLRAYERFTGRDEGASELTYDCKKLVLQYSLSSEMNVLARRLDRLSEFHRYSRDFTLESQRRALEEVVACFPIYRTYATVDSTELDQEDARHVRWAVRLAMHKNPTISESIFLFLEELLLLQHPQGLTAEQQWERLSFVLRLQQLTGPVMAKSIEDTLFYRYFPLASLCEVGSDPKGYGTSLRTFHEKSQIRLKHYPHALVATSTHDAKRGEDTRARINVLSEISSEWYRTVAQWREGNRRLKTLIEGEPAPSEADEYLIYQTLLGAWPLETLGDETRPEFLRRVQEYMRKAVREAKIYTSWVSPNEPYERALDQFLTDLLTPTAENRFLPAFEAFQQRVTRVGILNSLSQVILKMTGPGVPDFYQGCESWNFSLVDPDNRRPVEFVRLAELLDSILSVKPEELPCAVEKWLQNPGDGVIKMHVTQAVLRFRREHPMLFSQGHYIPMQADGPRKSHVIAFARRHESDVVLTICGRFFMSLGAGDGLPLGESPWQNTVVLLPTGFAGVYRDLLTGTTFTPAPAGKRLALSVGQLLGLLPGAVLVREQEGQGE